jgi:hypothetical protein
LLNAQEFGDAGAPGAKLKRLFMALVKFEILNRTPYENGKSFGATGVYERIDALAHYAVDPLHHANACITDLNLAPRDAQGMVTFCGDVTLLVPADRSRANRALLLEVPNRGHRIALCQLNMAPVDLASTARVESGDGHLFREGWTVAWCGWQWDVPRSESRIGLEPPYVEDGALLGDSQMQLRIQPDSPRTELPLTDQHVGAIGRHRPIVAADIDDPNAKLYVRQSIYGAATLIDRNEWRFGTGENGAPDAEYLWLRGGFTPGLIYDVVYRPARCPVAGAGLLAVRDLGAYLRGNPQAPTQGMLDQAVAEGISQCGRFLRTFLYFGLNEDEDGAAVYDGMLVHVAGGRRGEFNHRFAQPSVQPTPSFGHRFPFADLPQVDPHTGREEGLLDRVRAAGVCPRIIYTDTSSEYWRGDAGLTHAHAGDGSDVELPENVRRYLFSSTQHGVGQLPFTDESMFGSRGANAFNVVDYRPLYRAALANLLAWCTGQSAPPPSRYPRFGDGTAASRERVARTLGAIKSLALPNNDVLPYMQPLDLGPGADEGLGTHPAEPVGQAYPDIVSEVDENGNETGGVASPDVMCPVATHTGFNPRRADTGGAGQIIEYIGSSVPFASHEAGRDAVTDPRPSIGARYESRADYLAQIESAAHALVAQRYLLAEDVATYLVIAGERYDAALAFTRP